ncbi:MAG: hypothetical protein IKU76_04440 [Bacteroidaceae bacterium]|nr:hypothetical protein [Bacteroidaceae bacterium]
MAYIRLSVQDVATLEVTAETLNFWILNIGAKIGWTYRVRLALLGEVTRLVASLASAGTGIRISSTPHWLFSVEQ